MEAGRAIRRSRIVVVSQSNRAQTVISITSVVVECVVVSSYRSRIAIVITALDNNLSLTRPQRTKRNPTPNIAADSSRGCGRNLRILLLKKLTLIVWLWLRVEQLCTNCVQSQRRANEACSCSAVGSRYFCFFLFFFSLKLHSALYSAYSVILLTLCLRCEVQLNTAS